MASAGEGCDETCQIRTLLSFRNFSAILRNLLLTNQLLTNKKCQYCHFYAFCAKIWPKNMCSRSKSRFLFVWPFYMVTWDDLDLYYGHNSRSTVNDTYIYVSDTIHADSLFFTLNIEIVLADVTKPKNRTFWLWPHLWRPQCLLGQISHHSCKVHIHGEWRLNFGNRSSSLGDHREGRYASQHNVRLARAQRGAG